MDALTEITAICLKHRDRQKTPVFGNTLLVGEAIPDKWHSTIRQNFEMPPDARLIGFVDTGGMLARASCGFAVTDQGVSWVNNGSIMKSLWFRRSFMDWRNLASVTIEYTASWLAGSDKEDIVFDKQRRYTSGQAVSNKSLCELILELQEWGKTYVRVSETASLPEVFVDFDVEEEAWMVAFADESFGPYDVLTIHSLQRSGQIDSSSCLVWKEGLAEWMPLNSVKQLVPKQPAGPPALPKRSVESGPPPLPKRAAATPTGTMPATDLARVSQQQSPELDINSCEADELLSLPGMTKKRVEAITLHRTQQNTIRSFDELGRICGMKPHEVHRLEGKLAFGPQPEGTGAARRVVDF